MNKSRGPTRRIRSAPTCQWMPASLFHTWFGMSNKAHILNKKNTYRAQHGLNHIKIQRYKTNHVYTFFLLIFLWLSSCLGGLSSCLGDRMVNWAYTGNVTSAHFPSQATLWKLFYSGPIDLIQHQIYLTWFAFCIRQIWLNFWATETCL
jgi:hypothetical protein